MNCKASLLHERLGRIGVDALLLTTSEIVGSTNLRYVSGFTGSDAAILFTRSERHLFTDGRYKTQAEEETSGFQIHVERSKLDGICRTIRAAKIKRLAVEPARMSYQFAADLTKRVPAVTLVSLDRKFLDNFRIRKNHEEKSLIKKASSISAAACREILGRGFSGKTESQIAAELELLFRTYGAEGPAFDTIVASGARSALPHGTATDKVIENGELVVVDFGCRVAGYRSDQTVTCIVGAPTEEQKKIHQAVYNAHMKALNAAKSGVKVRALDAIARESIHKAGYGKFFMHGLGHGLGLETHEPPYLSPRGRGVLGEGMVFTIEPGIYIAGVGGVRLESLVYLGSSGPEVLSETPIHLIPVA